MPVLRPLMIGCHFLAARCSGEILWDLMGLARVIASGAEGEGARSCCVADEAAACYRNTLGEVLRRASPPQDDDGARGGDDLTGGLRPSSRL